MKKTKLLFIDVDGTLTRGDVIYTQSGEEIKKFNIKDGLALSVWNNKLGRISAIVTGRECEIVKKRASELGIQYVYMGVRDKGIVVREILKKSGVQTKECACIGDDVNDAECLNFVDTKFTVPNANKKIKAIENIQITQNYGGDGAFREIADEILEA